MAQAIVSRIGAGRACRIGVSFSAQSLAGLLPRSGDQRRLCKVYSWEEKRSKASWGAQIVDYEKIAGAAVQAMTAADLHRFLVLCALVSDLYCPGYNPRQSLAKDANLARAAARYKIDMPKTAMAIRIELSKPKTKVNEESQPAKKLTTATAKQPIGANRKRSK